VIGGLRLTKFDDPLFTVPQSCTRNRHVQTKRLLPRRGYQVSNADLSKSTPSVPLLPHRAIANLQCQKCLEYGHYSYECKATARPYKPRPTRTQQLKNPKLLPELNDDKGPNPLLEKYGLFRVLAYCRAGIADNLLKEKEEKRKRSESMSTYSSRSSSVSTYSSSSDEEDGKRDIKRVRRDSRSVSSSSSGRSRSHSPADRSRSASPEDPRGRPRYRRTRSISSGAEREGRDEDRSIPRGDFYSRKSPIASAPRQRSVSPHRRSPPRDRSPPRPARSRWDQRGGPSPPRERSLSPYSKRMQVRNQ
jgi:Zinc knuckle